MVKFTYIHLRSLIRCFFTILVVVLFINCSNDNNYEQTKIMADKLLLDISLGKANSHFPKKYFPRCQAIV